MLLEERRPDAATPLPTPSGATPPSPNPATTTTTLTLKWSRTRTRHRTPTGSGVDPAPSLGAPALSLTSSNGYGDASAQPPRFSAAPAASWRIHHPVDDAAAATPAWRAPNGSGALPPPSPPPQRERELPSPLAVPPPPLGLAGEEPQLAAEESGSLPEPFRRHMDRFERLSSLESSHSSLQLTVADVQRLSTWHEQVSVLFTDIQGFTAMSQQLHPSQVRRVLACDLPGGLGASSCTRCAVLCVRFGRSAGSKLGWLATPPTGRASRRVAERSLERPDAHHVQVMLFLNNLYSLFDGLLEEHDVYKVRSAWGARAWGYGQPSRRPQLQQRHGVHMWCTALAVPSAAG